MAAGRKRREPMFDFLPTPADLRVNARDRAGGDGEAPRRARARRERDEAPARRKRGRGGKGGGRSPFGRLFCGALSLACGLAIAGIGTLVWVGAHLPPLQSLEFPSVRPTIQIVGIDGRPLATRGDMGGAAHPAEGVAGPSAEGVHRHRGPPVLSPLRHRPDRPGARARRQRLRRGVSQGGSTITQQLAKNLFLTQERTMSASCRKLMLALVARAQVQQERDPRALSQPRLFRRRRLRRRSGGATLFRQVGAPA